MDDVVSTMMSLFETGTLDICVHPPTVADLVSDRPTAAPLARLQATSGNTVTNQRHENVRLDDFCRFLVKNFSLRRHIEHFTRAEICFYIIHSSKYRFRFHNHAGAAAVRIIVYLLMFIFSKISYIVNSYF